MSGQMNYRSELWTRGGWWDRHERLDLAGVQVWGTKSGRYFVETQVEKWAWPRHIHKVNIDFCVLVPDPLYLATESAIYNFTPKASFESSNLHHVAQASASLATTKLSFACRHLSTTSEIYRHFSSVIFEVKTWTQHGIPSRSRGLSFVGTHRQSQEIPRLTTKLTGWNNLAWLQV